jgi:hypothetical protein
MIRNLLLCLMSMMLVGALAGCPCECDDQFPQGDDDASDDDDDVTTDDDDFVNDDDDFVDDDDDFVDDDDDDTEQYDGTIEGTLDFGAVTATSEAPYTIALGVFLPENFDPGTMTIGDPETALDIVIPSLPDMFMVGYEEGTEVYVVAFLDDNGNGLGDGPDSGDLIGFTASPVMVSATDVTLTFDALIP